MLELDESTEEGAIIRVVGIGTFGLRVVGNMVGSIQQVECLGVESNSPHDSGNLPMVFLPRDTKEGHHDVATLMEKLATADLVFVVANLDEEEDLLGDICNALHNSSIYTFLVIPESTCSMEKHAGLARSERVENVTLDGVLIISEFSMEQPYPATWKGKDESSQQDHFFQQGIRLITDLFTIRGPIGIDFCDVIGKICGRIMRFGVGIARGEGRTLNAAEKALACLIRQGVMLQTINSTLNSISGSYKNMQMDDYNSVNTFAYEHFCLNDECCLLLASRPDDNLADNILVSFIAARRPSEEAVFPSWVKINDKYDRMRHSKQAAHDSSSSIIEDDEDNEVPSWLRKTL